MLEVNTPPLVELTPQQAREYSKQFENMFPWATPAKVAYRDALVQGSSGQVPVRVFTPGKGASAKLPVLIYLHGGGWVMGGHTDPDIQSTCAFLADAAGCVVVSVGYRLAPESRFPAPVEDSYSVLKWLSEGASELGVDSGRIAVAGDSAGGNIAAALCLMARDRGGPRIVAQVLVYPVTDDSFETESYRACGEGYELATEEMQWFWGKYLARPEDGGHPYASILRAPDLTRLPPALVLTAEFDPLRDEGEAYAARLLEAGVPARLVRYDGAIHGFFTLPFGERGREEAAGELRRAFSGYPSGPT